MPKPGDEGIVLIDGEKHTVIVKAVETTFILVSNRELGNILIGKCEYIRTTKEKYIAQGTAKRFMEV